MERVTCPRSYSEHMAEQDSNPEPRGRSCDSILTIPSAAPFLEDKGEEEGASQTCGCGDMPNNMPNRGAEPRDGEGSSGQSGVDMSVQQVDT